MNKLLLSLATLFFLTFSGLQAQEQLNALFYHAGFYSPTDGPYVETYLKVFGQSANFQLNENGKYQASVKVTILLKQEEDIKEWRNYNLFSEEYEDSSRIDMSFIDQQRIPVPPGIYQLEVLLKDNHSESEALEIVQMTSLDFNQDKLQFSGIQFVENFTPTQEDNILSKSGFDLVPFVGDFFDESMDALTFYTELYNCDEKLGKGNDLLIRYHIESFETRIPLEQFQKYQRQQAQDVNVVFASLPIGDLPSGNYNLVIEARDQQDQIILSTGLFFMKSNPAVRINFEDLKAVDITATFAEKIVDQDSLKFYVGSLLPIATSTDRKHITSLEESGELAQLQKFLYSFWKTINPDYPEEEWYLYQREVNRVERSYATKIRHGYETDQGRIWLKYGAPDDAENSVHESAEYPYIIWHYYRLGYQNNVKFMFYNPHLVGTEYYIAYTNARGETYDPSWEGLNRRGNPMTQSGSAFWGSRMDSKIVR